MDEVVEIENAVLIFESLSEILPDADPTFLERVSQEYSLKHADLNTYIENLLKSNNYPKKVVERPEHPAPNVVSAHRNSVEEFINKFPNPHKYFSERNVGISFLRDSKLFLMQRFRFMSVKNIEKVLKSNNGNLTLAKEVLAGMNPDRCSKRPDHTINAYIYSKDDTFQDEVFFLEFETAITLAIAEKEAYAKLQFEEAKKRKELFECQCCFNDEVLIGDVVTCADGHIFCSECVKKSTEVAFGDGKTKFICLCDCESDFNLDSLKTVLSDNLYNKIQSKIQEAEVKSADISGICFCPFCEYAEVPPDEEKVFRCKICLKESCRFCNSEVHIPLSCEEFNMEKKKSSARSLIEDKMTEALVRECYKCKKKFVKEDGCNKMVCVCGAMMCYLCRQPVKDYTHFNNNLRQAAHPQPSTSQSLPKCPLWSQNRQLHIDAVVKAAMEATAEVERQNPDVHFEQSQLLKGLKRKFH